MTKEELIERYSALSSHDKVQFLAQSAHNLTIALRGDYDSEDLPFRVKRLEGANELQHHLSSELSHHHDDDIKRYPDDVLINILVEKAAAFNLGGAMRWALERTAERFTKSTTPSAVE